MNDDTYFSEREQGLLPQDEENITQRFWNGFSALVEQYTNDGSLAEAFSVNCDEFLVPVAADTKLISFALKADIPSVYLLPLSENVLPDTLSALNVVEFFYRQVSKPTERMFHRKFRHNDLFLFDKEAGQEDYLKNVNRLFRRNNLAFELKANGKVERLGPIILRDILASTTFHTEDPELNRLLEDARIKIGDRDLTIRREAVEKLWDAWERLKTLEPGNDKKKQINELLTKAIPQAAFRASIDKEAKELADLGNNFRIRHSETDKPIISEAESVVYLFYRLFALMHLLLRKTNRTR